MPVASKTRPLYFSPSLVVADAGDAEVVQRHGQRLGEPTAAAGDDGAVDEGGALAPALQLGRVGQSEVLHEQLPDRAGGEGLVVVGHHVFLWSTAWVYS